MTVKTVRLDDAVEGKIGLIKVDVEGHELAVLEGAVRILNTDRPNLIIELEDRHSSGIVQKAFQFLQGIGYQAYGLVNGRMTSCPWGDNPPPELWNFIFTHSEREKTAICS